VAEHLCSDFKVTVVLLTYIAHMARGVFWGGFRVQSSQMNPFLLQKPVIYA